MKLINDDDIKRYRRQKKVKPSDVADILNKREQSRNPAEPNVDNGTKSIQQLVLSVNQAIQSSTELNHKTLGLVSSLFVKISEYRPLEPAKLPPIILPSPAKRWRFTVQRDNRNLIEFVDAERIE